MTLPTHVDTAELDWIALGATGWHRATVTLEAGDTAENPASTSRLIYGPAIVTFDRAPDGGIIAHVEETS